MPKTMAPDGLAIHYRVHDYVDPWLAREVVVLQHGLGRNGEFWLPWIRPLSLEFTIVTVDLIGHGQSDPVPSNYEISLERYAEHVLSVLDDLDVDKAHYVGESLGGVVGLELGRHHSNRLATLTLSGTPFKPAAGSQDLGALTQAMRKDGMTAWVNGVLKSRLDWDAMPEGMYLWCLRQVMNIDAESLARQIEYQMTLDLEETLDAIATRTLLLIPSDNAVGAMDQMHIMHGRMPAATAVTFPDGGHWVYYTAAHRCVREFQAFVA